MYTLGRGERGEPPFHTFSQLISIHANEPSPTPYDSVGSPNRVSFLSTLTIMDSNICRVGREFPYTPIYFTRVGRKFLGVFSAYPQRFCATYVLPYK